MAALGLVVLYVYAVVSFAFLHESFLFPDNDDGTLFCDDLFECFVSTIRYGLIDNLGLVSLRSFACNIIFVLVVDTNVVSNNTMADCSSGPREV